MCVCVCAHVGIYMCGIAFELTHTHGRMHTHAHPERDNRHLFVAERSRILHKVFVELLLSIQWLWECVHAMAGRCSYQATCMVSVCGKACVSFRKLSKGLCPMAS